jgi:metal-dependent amidase/aminoacylase/carboxypeptidase family protein
MILSFNAINSLRQHITAKARIHGIITNGGQAPNVVPAYTAGSFMVRSDDLDYLEDLKKRVINCFTGAATATGARLEYQWDELCYAPLLNNLSMARLFVDNMRRIGRRTKMVDPDKSFGSTDFGNVSQLVPGIHGSVSITTGRGVVTHSPQFAAAAASEKGLNAMLDAAKALAMTAADLMADPELMAKARNEFYQRK